MNDETDDPPGTTLIPPRPPERPNITDSAPYDAGSMLRRGPLPQATAQDVRAAKKAALVEQATTDILEEVHKQTNAFRGITDDFAHVLRTRAETAVYVERSASDFLEEKRRQALIHQQMRIDDVLFADQLNAQKQKLDLAAAERARADRDAEFASRAKGRAPEDAARVAAARDRVEAEEREFRTRHERMLVEERTRRTNEREEAEHKLAVAQAEAGLKNVTAPPKTDPFRGAVSGDYAEAMNIAEDVADGHVLTDSRHTYHAYAALMWLEGLKREEAREDALRRIATKVLDRQLRHPLTERDARMYDAQYHEARRQYDAEIVAARIAREKHERAEAHAAAAKLKADTDVRKAQMDRDAALARERTAKVFVDADSYDATDPDDAN